MPNLERNLQRKAILQLLSHVWVLLHQQCWGPLWALYDAVRRGTLTFALWDVAQRCTVSHSATVWVQKSGIADESGFPEATIMCMPPLNLCQNSEIVYVITLTMYHRSDHLKNDFFTSINEVGHWIGKATARGYLFVGKDTSLRECASFTEYM